MGEQAVAAIVAAIIMGMAGLGVAVLAFVSSTRIQRQTDRIARQTEEFKRADLHSAEAVSLRASFEEQAATTRSISRELLDCQQHHIEDMGERLEMDERLRTLESDNAYLRRQMDGWLRRDAIREGSVGSQ